ncbi:ATP-binding protein [Myxococcaceae bacterium GXIMD 01537]
MAPPLAPRTTEAPAPQLALSWPAALIGLLFGVLMTYVPYEFRVAAYRPLYPYVRHLGVAYLAGSIALLWALLYPRAPRAVDLVGRLVFTLATVPFWWVLTVRTSGLTGPVLYPLLLMGLWLEAVPPARRRPALRPLLGAAATAFGAAMLLAPEQFWPLIHLRLAPLRWVEGGLFLGGGVLLLVPAVARRPSRARVTLGLLAVPYAMMASVLAQSSAWMGMSVHAICALACVADACAFRLRAPRTVGWKLLRGLAFAGLVPLLALGGLAAFLAQHAIEAQVREDTLGAAAGEAHFLRRYLDDAREAMQLQLESPGFRKALAAGEREVVEAHLSNLPAQARAFDAALVALPDGTPVATSSGTLEALAALLPRVPAETQRAGTPWVSPPFTGLGGRPVVAVSLPFATEGGPRGLLVGLLSLERLSSAHTPAARRFRVQVVDARGPRVLRDTAPEAPPLSEAPLATSDASGGVRELFDTQDRRLLAAEAAVPEVPWRVRVTQELGVAYGAITRMSAAVVGLVVLGVLLTLALSQLVARDVIRRLARLREATAALATGHLGRRVEVEEDDELGDLERGFNEMAARTGASQVELREAGRTREEFLSVASHELRTPLTPLKGFAALTLQRLERSGDFAEHAWLLKALRSMARQTERLTRLVDDLLDTSRIQGGRFELERQRVDLLPVLREALERFELRGEGALRFELRAPEEPVEGEWDAPRLDQVVTNLLSNAVRYSPEGGTVSLSLLVEPSQVELRVADEGIGIPAESVRELFRPFARASNATSRHFGGLGLGLFICREIVERHGGRIWAESAGPEQGSCFHVRLPRAAPPPVAVSPPGRADSHPGAPPG